MTSRVPPIGFIGINAGPASFKYVRNQGLRSATTVLPVPSSHKLMMSAPGNVQIVAPNADKEIRSLVRSEAMGAAQLIMNTGLMRKTRRGFGPANSI
jgi:hypothetical protein